MLVHGLLLLSLIGGIEPELSLFLKASKSGVKWDSRVHHHIYKKKELEVRVQRIIDRVISDPKAFELEMSKVSQEVRDRLTNDSVDSRIEPIDLLSVELKERIQVEWKRTFGDGIPYDHSHLWALSKYRLSKAINNAHPRDSGVYLFRKPGLQSREFVLGCADRITKSGLKVSEDFNLGGVLFERAALDTGVTVNWSCGNRGFELSAQKQNSRELRIPDKFDLASAYFSGKIKIGLIIGLTSTVSETMFRATKYFLRLKSGYKIKEIKNTRFKGKLASLLREIDIFLPLIAYPHSNRISFSMVAESGMEVVYTKEIDHPTKQGKKVEVELTVLLPPLKSEEVIERQKKEDGVHFSQEQLAEVFNDREKINPASLTVLDYSCFGQRNFTHWNAAFRRSTGKKPPLMIASRRGQQGEGTLEVINTMNTVLSGLDVLISGGSIEEVKAELNKKRMLEKILGWMDPALSWVGLSSDIGSEFKPVMNIDEPYREFFSAKDSYSIHLQASEVSREALRIFAPVL